MLRLLDMIVDGFYVIIRQPLPDEPYSNGQRAAGVVLLLSLACLIGAFVW